VTHPNMASGGLDFEHDHLDIRSDRERPRDITIPCEASLAEWHQTCAPWREEYEHAELLETLDLAPHARPWPDLAGRNNRFACARRSFGDERDADPPCGRVDVQDLERCGHADRHRLRPSAWRSGRGKRRRMSQSFNPRRELHECPELGNARDAPRADLADL